jgi:adenylate kinase
MDRSPLSSSYEPDVVTLISYPGAGKNTVSTVMLEDLRKQEIRSEYYEAGETVRSHIRGKTPFGQLVKDYNERGLLVPDEYIVPVVRADIERLQTEAVWFLDGFPRSTGQVRPYQEMMEDLERRDVILNLELDKDPQISAEMAAARIAHRREQAILHGREVRKDDLDPTKRLDEAKKLHDVLAQLRETGSRIITIDAKPKPDVVVAQLRRTLAVRILTAADLEQPELRQQRPRLVVMEQSA